MKTNIFFVLLGLFILSACNNSNNNEKQASVSSSATNASESAAQQTSSLSIDLIGDWIITDWDENIDEGNYDPGDIIQFRNNGVFKGFYFTDIQGVGKWTVSGSTLTIQFDEIEVEDDSNVMWTLNSLLTVQLTIIDEDNMRWIGRFRNEGYASNGESAIETPKIAIDLKRR